MSKGQEAIAMLQKLFGQAVEPTLAITLMQRKIEEQEQRLVFLKNLVTALAFDRGALLNAVAPLQHPSTCTRPAEGGACSCGLDALAAHLNLPVVDLAEKVVGVAAVPKHTGRIITG